MDAESYTDLLPIILLGVVFFVSAIAMLYWSSKRGQFRNFDSQASTIFTDEEPEGEISDSFPSK
ncbi:MAG: cbb3-type cytochrome oxidase assembly protein CcoS [Opitutaceae bacterium]